MNLDPKNLKRDFVRFMVASVVAQWIFALYSAVDGMFVARGVSEIALSAVNIASPFTNFLFSVSLMFAVGTSTLASIHLGRGEKEKANALISQNLALLVGLSVVITATVLIFPDQIARFLGAKDATIEYVKDYITTLAPFSCCFIVAYSFEILVKTDGFPRFATIAVTSGCLINCVLDYLLVFVIPLEVFGAALATGISQLCLVGIYLWHFLGPKGVLKIGKFRFSPSLVLKVMKVGLPSGLTEFSAGITVFLFNHAILTYISEEAVVSYTIVAYVNTLVVMAMAGVAQGAQPLISYFYGQNNQAVCQKLLRYCIVAACGFALAFFAFSMVGADLVVNLFVSPEMEALRHSSGIVFRIFSISFLVMGFNIVVSGFFTAVERPAFSLIISLCRGLVTISIALFIMTALFGGDGIWWASTVSELLCLGVTALLMVWYRRQRNKS